MSTKKIDNLAPIYQLRHSAMRNEIAINLSGIHPLQYHSLKEDFHCDQDLLMRPTSFYESLKLSEQVWKKLQSPNQSKIDYILAWAKKNQIALLKDDDSAYPKQLKDLPCWPPLLYACGNVDILTKVGIGIVGSRNASIYGLENTKEFATDLAHRGYCIISGLATGVDATAHTACLEAKQQTIAIVGLGLDNITPRKNRPLADKIMKQGCIVSEMPPLTPYQKHCFPRRNRLISAMGIGTLVTEAQRRSGTLTTAQFCIDIHRPLMTIPGRIKQPQAKGCHMLIQAGAHLVTCGQECHEIVMHLG